MNRAAIVRLLDGKCYICDSTKHLHVHHVDGMGAYYRAQYKNDKARYWREVANMIQRKGVVLLCAVHHGKLHAGQFVLFFGNNRYGFGGK